MAVDRGSDGSDDPLADAFVLKNIYFIKRNSLLQCPVWIRLECYARPKVSKLGRSELREVFKIVLASRSGNHLIKKYPKVGGSKCFSMFRHFPWGNFSFKANNCQCTLRKIGGLVKKLFVVYIFYAYYFDTCLTL